MSKNLNIEGINIENVTYTEYNKRKLEQEVVGILIKEEYEVGRQDLDSYISNTWWLRVQSLATRLGVEQEIKKDIVEYIKNNGVYFFTANDDDQGYSKDDPRYDIDYCEDRCEGYYLDTEFNKNISFEPLDIYTEFDLGHARMYYQEKDTIKQL